MTDLQAQLRQLKTTQGNLRRRLKTNILGEFKHSRAEIAEAFDTYCQLYKGLQPHRVTLDEMKFPTPRQFEKAIKSKRPLSLKAVTRLIKIRVQNLEEWSRWEPRDSPTFPAFYFDDYRTDYALVCQRWPHLADILPTPEDAERFNFPAWVSTYETEIFMITYVEPALRRHR